MRKFSYIAILTVVFSCSTLFLTAATITAEVAGGDWNTGTTWVGGGVPAADDDVIIPSGATVTYTGDLSKGSGTLTINSGGVLTISGALTANVATTIDGTVNVGTTFSSTGGSGVTIGSAGNLSVASTAATSTTVVVTGTMTVTSNYTVSGGSLTVSATTGLLTVGGTFSTNSNVTLDGTMSVTGNYTHTGGETTSGTSSGLTVGGSFTATGTTTFNGEVELTGNFSGTSITTGSSSIIVIKGDVSTNGTINLSGDLLVSGDYTMTGGTVTVASGAVLSVGEDFDKGGNNVVISAGGYGIVYGDYTSTGGSTTITGELVTIGDVSGCAACTNKTIDPTDPVWSFTEGVVPLYWEDFNSDTKNAQSTWSDAYSSWTLTSPAQIVNDSVRASFSSRVTQTLWESGEIVSGCYSNVYVSAYVTGTGKASAVLQYSTYNSGSWSVWAYNPQTAIPVHSTNTNLRVNTTPINAAKLKLRLIVNDIVSGYTVNLDNVGVSGTLGLGEELPAIVLDPDFDEQAVCDGASFTYKLTQVYDGYSWSVTGGTLNTSATLDYANVTWGAGPTRELSVTVSNDCGRQEPKTWEMTALATLGIVLVDKTDLVCASSNTGAISVSGVCGSGSYTYSFNGGAYTATNSWTNLAEGTYTIVCKDGVPTASIEVEISSPSPITITLNETSVTSSCDASFGCNGTLDFEVSGGSGQLAVELDNDAGTLTLNPTVRIDFTSTSDQPASGYQYFLTLYSSRFPGMLTDFSDVRFFSDRELTVQLAYWQDPDLLVTGTSSGFYVRTDVSPGTNSFYMVYGSHSYQDLNSITSVLDNGSFYVQAWSNAGYSGTANNCTETHTSYAYSNPSTICSVTLSTASASSFYWAGWYTIPNETYIKVIAASGATSNVYINGSILTGGDNGGGGATEYKRYTLDPGILGTTVFLEFWFSKPAGVDSEIGAVFSSNNGNYTAGQVQLDFTNGYSKKYLSPEPSPPTFVESYVFTGLCQGDYILTVTDVSNPSCSATENVSITNDGDTPAFANFPPDYTGLLADAVSVSGQTLLNEPFSLVVGTSGHKNWASDNWAMFDDRNNDLRFLGNGNAYVQYPISTLGFEDIIITLEAYQSGALTDEGWDATDYLEVLYTTNGSDWTSLLQDVEVWQGVSGTENITVGNDGNQAGAMFTSAALPAAADGNTSFAVRIYMISNATDEQYYLKNLTITGTMQNSVAIEDTGTPDVTEGGVASLIITPTFIDAVELGCSGGNKITRTWSATDECGKSVSQDQIITLAAALPTFTGVVDGPDPSYSFCNNSFTLTIPSTSACTPWEVGYTFDGGTTKVPLETDLVADPDGEVSFTLAIDQSYTFNWYVTDGINATNYSADFPITISPEISIPDIRWAYNSDFCVGEPVTIEVSPLGGSGSYTTYSFTTTESALDNFDDEDLVDNQFTSSFFSDGDYIDVAVTDDEGCSTDDNAMPGPLRSPDALVVRPQVVTPAITY